MKKLLLIAAFVATTPMMAFAQMSKAELQSACEAFSDMTELTATFRDSGLSAPDAYIQMVKNGLHENVALTITKIVYDQAPTQSPSTIKCISYIACMQAANQ